MPSLLGLARAKDAVARITQPRHDVAVVVQFFVERRHRDGHVGIYRDPATLEPVEYYFKVPSDIAERMVIVCDPMLATGNSAVAAINRLKEHGVTSIQLVCLLAAPEGVRTMLEGHPDVTVTVAALDEKLNDHGYIVPGLGDAGDRIFGTR